MSKQTQKVWNFLFFFFISITLLKCTSAKDDHYTFTKTKKIPEKNMTIISTIKITKHNITTHPNTTSLIQLPGQPYEETEKKHQRAFLRKNMDNLRIAGESP